MTRKPITDEEFEARISILMVAANDIVSKGTSITNKRLAKEAIARGLDLSLNGAISFVYKLPGNIRERLGLPSKTSPPESGPNGHNVRESELTEWAEAELRRREILAFNDSADILRVKGIEVTPENIARQEPSRKISLNLNYVEELIKRLSSEERRKLGISA